MWFTSLLPSLKRRTGHRAKILRKRPTSGFAPSLEILEDRTVPSTLTVLNNLDGGAGSLRDAIQSAHNGDTIDFTPSLAGQTITLTSGELAIEKDLDIEGPGASLLAVSGNDSSRVFVVRSAASVIIAGLTITHGRITGAGIQETKGGGGILNDGGTLSLRADILSYNQALGNDNVSWFGGGAVYNVHRAHLTITDSTFDSNLAVGRSGGFGGAITSTGNSTATVARSLFIHNQARGLDGGTVHGQYLGDVGLGQGGAIVNFGESVMIVEDSTFTDNQAIAGNGGNGGAGPGAGQYAFIGLGFGGAISNQHECSLTLRRSTLTGNQAIGGSGITGGSRGNNWLGVALGGGLFNQGVVEVSDSTFDRNDALAGNDNTGGNPLDVVGLAGGGAIHNDGFEAGTGILIARNTIFTGNRAIGGRGSGQGSGGLAWGGALSVHNLGEFRGTTASLIGCMLHGNQAIGGAGGVGGSGGNGFGGAVYNDAMLNITASTIADNEANGGAAGAGGAVGVGEGGGLYLVLDGTVCVDAFTWGHIKHNHASTSDDDIFGVFSICS